MNILRVLRTLCVGLLPSLTSGCLSTDWCDGVECKEQEACNLETAQCECMDELCPGGFSCQKSGVCNRGCWSNDSNCREGYGCSDGDCVPLCVEDECPNGLRCADKFSCFDRCRRDVDCRDGFECIDNECVGSSED